MYNVVKTLLGLLGADLSQTRFLSARDEQPLHIRAHTPTSLKNKLSVLRGEIVMHKAQLLRSFISAFLAALICFNAMFWLPEGEGSNRYIHLNSPHAENASMPMITVTDRPTDLLLARPIFNPDRRPVRVVISVPTGTTEVLPRLAGTDCSSIQKVAFFRDDELNRNWVVSEGGRVRAWTVSSISPGNVRLIGPGGDTAVAISYMKVPVAEDHAIKTKTLSTPSIGSRGTVDSDGHYLNTPRSDHRLEPISLDPGQLLLSQHRTSGTSLPLAIYSK